MTEVWARPVVVTVGRMEVLVDLAPPATLDNLAALDRDDRDHRARLPRRIVDHIRRLEYRYEDEVIGSSRWRTPTYPGW